MKTSITIESVNFLSGQTYADKFNAKVLYRKNGKLELAHVFIDYFNKQVFVPKQPKECKVLKGFNQAIQEHEFKTS
jgi:hypothetical protein